MPWRSRNKSTSASTHGGAIPRGCNAETTCSDRGEFQTESCPGVPSTINLINVKVTSYSSEHGDYGRDDIRKDWLKMLDEIARREVERSLNEYCWLARQMWALAEPGVSHV